MFFVMEERDNVSQALKVEVSDALQQMTGDTWLLVNS